jgi:hypothetical protein
LLRFARNTQNFHIVTTGLDPVVHAEVRKSIRRGRNDQPNLTMDCRVKPGNDERRVRVVRKRT